MSDKGAKGQVRVVASFFHAWRVRGHRSHASFLWRSGGTVTGHSEEQMRVVGTRKGPGRCEWIRDDPRTEH